MKNQQHHAHDTGGAEQIGRKTEAAKPCTLRKYGAELLPVAVVVTDNRTIVVLADSTRYGKNAIMYEGHTFMSCCDYIRRVTGKNHFQMKASPVMRTFTDTEGRTMPWMMDVVF